MQRYVSCRQRLGIAYNKPKEPLPFTHPGVGMPFASASWLLDCYLYDMAPRREQLLAEMTSTFGDILKIDSTKKVTKMQLES